MPIYEYRCLDCGSLFSRLQSISNPPAVTPCPECGSERTERQHSTFAAAGSSSGTAASPGTPGCGSAGGG